MLVADVYYYIQCEISLHRLSYIASVTIIVTAESEKELEK